MSGTRTVTGVRLVTPEGVIERGALIADSGRIVEVSDGSGPARSGAIDGAGLTALPGFLDVHIHGGGGADTMDATPDALRAICRIHARFGTTGLLATTMTQSRERIAAALRNARAAAQTGADFCPDGAQILGIHLEGPYINPLRPGAQPKQFVRDYDAEEFADWLEITHGTMKLITLASERPGGDVLMAACRAAGIVVSLGHTDATAEETIAAIDAGAAHGTHLFNAMPPLHHRKPGTAAVLMTDDRVKAEVIADGHHVAPTMIELALRAKGAKGVILITDAMAGAGVGDGLYDLGGLPVTVANGRAVLADGTLAGSVLTMGQAAANLRGWFGTSWSDLARLTSANAAEQMGWNNKGRLTPGADADFVLVDDALNVHATFIAGRPVYRR